MHGPSLRLFVGIAFAGALSILPACIDHGGGVVSVEASASGTTLPSVSRTRPVEGPGLHNLVAFHDGLVSGGVPEGDEAFAFLAKAGVGTVVSVDGAVPEVEAARRHGLRYIHLPIGYDGIDETRRLELARAVRDAMADGGVYLHCHHGRHRSAAACSSVVVGLGWSTTDEALERMRIAGTSPRYAGLFAVVAEATPMTDAEVDAVDPDFPEISRPDDLVDAMVEMDRALDHLRLIAASGWRTPPSHPDLVPAAEAGRLADLLRVAAAGKRARSEVDPEFAAWMSRDSGRVAALEESLLQDDLDVPALDAQLAAIRTSCSACHAAHRD